MDEVKFSSLTAGERLVLRKAALGTTSKEIAQEVQLSHQTVDTYLKNACRKLGISGRRAAGLALLKHEKGISQELGYQPDPLAERPELADFAAQAIRSEGGRDDLNGLVFREERASFEVNRKPQPWWHPARWGSDVELSTGEKLRWIVILAVGTAAIWYFVVASSALLESGPAVNLPT